MREAAAGRRYLGPPLSDAAVRAYAERRATKPIDPYDILNDRERQVLQLTAEGNRSRIGERLYVSSRTVETHRANLLRKLGLHSQTELVRYALAKGLIPLQPLSGRPPKE